MDMCWILWQVFQALDCNQWHMHLHTLGYPLGFGGTDAPAGNGYTKIYSTNSAFAALRADGSIKAWGAPA
jgi:hypothetical protein